MKIALYNQMFGLDGKSMVSNILGHYYIHFQKNPEKALKRTDIGRTIDIVQRSRADVVGICEILEGQDEELKEKLGKLGYGFVFFGDGHRTKHSGMRVKVAIASKIECEKREIKNFPIRDELGGGGGFAYGYFPGIKTHMLCVHFAINQNKKLYGKELSFLQDFIGQLEGKVILASDFNKSYSEIRDYFPGLEIHTHEIKTCSLTPGFRQFHFKDDDHVLARGFNSLEYGFLEGFSDHRLVYADLE
jgi:endonuclease/exonuclease/phosphatase (EEP) superfamily protein YafD